MDLYSNIQYLGASEIDLTDIRVMRAFYALAEGRAFYLWNREHKFTHGQVVLDLFEFIFEI